MIKENNEQTLLPSRNYWKFFIAPCIFLMLFFVLHYLYYKGYIHYQPLIVFCQTHPYSAPLVFIGLYALAVLIMIPTLPLNLAAGFIFSTLWGGVLTTLGAGGGAILAFLLARSTFGKPLAKRFNHQWFVWLQKKLASQGWKWVAFVRLSPGIPTGPINFLFGLTSISFIRYSWATLIFLFPPSLAFSFVGHSASGYLLHGDTHHLIRLIATLLIAFTLVSFLFPSLVRHYFEKAKA